MCSHEVSTSFRYSPAIQRQRQKPAHTECELVHESRRGTKFECKRRYSQHIASFARNFACHNSCTRCNYLFISGITPFFASLCLLTSLVHALHSKSLSNKNHSGHNLVRAPYLGVIPSNWGLSCTWVDWSSCGAWSLRSSTLNDFF